MQDDKRFWYGLMAVALVLGGLWIGASRVPQSSAATASAEGQSAPRTGFMAPDFGLTTLEGETVQLSELRGQPVLINFWASWCGPCRVEMPHIQAAFETHRERGLVVLAVNQLEPAPPIANFVDQFGLTFPVPLDSDGQVSRTYQVRGLPTTFFVDAEGVIRDTFTGPMSAGLLESKLNLILPAATES